MVNRSMSEARYLLRSYGWSDEFNLFRINHKPSPIFAALDIDKDHRRSEAGSMPDVAPSHGRDRWKKIDSKNERKETRRLGRRNRGRRRCGTRKKRQWQMVTVDERDGILSVVVVMVEERRRFRKPRSTFNHLRSITSAEVMAAFSCRGRI